MGLLKKTENSEHVTREEFEALSAQLESFKAIAALAFAAVDLALNGSPGMPDSSPRRRLQLLAAAADLEPQESAQLQDLLQALDRAGKVESKRQFAESAERARPRRDWVPSWRG
jgi:hypothetical protein